MDMIKVGPAGKQGRSATIWDEKGRGEIAKIFISYDCNTVYSLHFLFYNEYGKLLSQKHGTGSAYSLNLDSVAIDYPSEFLTSLSGSFRSSMDGNTTILSSIAFGTNKGSYGPFGNPSSTNVKHFNFQIGNQFTVGGFYGSISGGYIDSFGIYMKIHYKEEDEEDEFAIYSFYKK